MGRMTEYFNYLKVEPKNLQEFKDNMYYLKVTEDIKKQRSKLKLYKK